MNLPSRATIPILSLLVSSLLLPAMGAGAEPAQGEDTRLPEPVYRELREDFFMDAAVDLLQHPRSRIEMHSYLIEELGAFFFLLPQPAGGVTTDEFRPTGPASIQSLILTMEMPDETLRMVHVLLSPDSEARAQRFIEGALQSADQGGPRETKLYLLGIQEVEGTQFQVLLRQETSSAGTLMYWIHYY